MTCSNLVDRFESYDGLQRLHLLLHKELSELGQVLLQKNRIGFCQGHKVQGTATLLVSATHQSFGTVWRPLRRWHELLGLHRLRLHRDRQVDRHGLLRLALDVDNLRRLLLSGGISLDSWLGHYHGGTLEDRNFPKVCFKNIDLGILANFFDISKSKRKLSMAREQKGGVFSFHLLMKDMILLLNSETLKTIKIIGLIEVKLPRIPADLGCRAAAPCRTAPRRARRRRQRWRPSPPPRRPRRTWT